MSIAPAPGSDSWYTAVNSIMSGMQRLVWLLPRDVHFNTFMELAVLSEHTARRGGSDTYQEVYCLMLDRRDAGLITEDNPADLWRECEREALGLVEPRAKVDSVREWFHKAFGE